MQFLFDKSGVGQPCRQWMCVTLGTWHPYKQANMVIWNHWASRVFAPLFHELIPDAKFMTKPKLVAVVHFFTYVRLAYPKFRKQLKDALNHCRVADTLTHEYSQLVDLRHLCEFFIPVVRQSAYH